jgi:hypothetical protein
MKKLNNIATTQEVKNNPEKSNGESSMKILPEG